MIETITTQARSEPSSFEQPAQKQGKKYNFGLRPAGERGDGYARTAGAMPREASFKTAKAESLEQLEKAGRGESQFEYILSYAIEEAKESPEDTADQGYSFYDVLDVVNPLQHLPIVSSVYRTISGDELKAAPRIVGGAIFGGVAGVVSSTANVILEEQTGRDITGNALAALTGQELGKPQTPDIRIDHSRNLLNHQAGVFMKAEETSAENYEFEFVQNEQVTKQAEIVEKLVKKNFSRNASNNFAAVRAYEQRYNS